MLRVAARLRRLLGLALCGEAALFEAPALFANGTHQTGLVYYHAEPSEPLRGRLGIRPHADGGMFTLLWTDGSAGLHICPDKGAVASGGGGAAERVWVAVPRPPRGALVVNLGAMLERWSNGRFRATCLLYTSPSPRDGLLSRMPSSA